MPILSIRGSTYKKALAVIGAIAALGVLFEAAYFFAARSDPYAAAILACYPKSPTGAEDTPIPNNSVQYVKETTRVFVNLPQNLYSKNILHSWTTVAGNATALYISNGGPPGEAMDATPGCWSTYVEFDGSGEVDLRAKSAASGAPDYFVRFIVSPT